MKRLGVIFAAVGPGLFLIGYNIGTGSIVTMAKAGANHGMTLFWAVALSCVFTYVLMVAYGKLTIITGQTALRNFRLLMPVRGLGNVLAIYVLTALILGEILALIGIVGIVTDLLKEGTVYIIGGDGLSKPLLTTILAVFLFYFFWTGSYKRFEKVFVGFVSFMACSFLLVFIMVKPDMGTILSGLVPRVPDTPGSMGIIAAMAGTTVSAAVFIIRSTIVAEKGWTVENLAGERRDAAVSASVMLFLSGIIMAVSAGTLFVAGIPLDNTIDLIHLFEPIGGKAASIILILGITAAGISTIFPIVLIAPWLLADYMGKPRDIQSPMFRILGTGGILLAFLTLIIKQRPPAVMLFSQGFQALILPLVIAPVIYLLNNRKVMGDHVASPILNCGLIAAFLFSLLTSYFAVAELIFSALQA